jgi:hypothetical protein
MLRMTVATRNACRALTLGAATAIVLGACGAGTVLGDLRHQPLRPRPLHRRRLRRPQRRCRQSKGSTSSTCTQLFGLTTPDGGQAPTDTRRAALTIALYPGSQVPALYQLSRTSAGLFTPDLGNVTPNDWTMAINFTGGSLTRSSTAAMAIDAEGNVWVSSAQCDASVTNARGCVIELSPQGAQTTTPRWPSVQRVDRKHGCHGEQGCRRAVAERLLDYRYHEPGCLQWRQPVHRRSPGFCERRYEPSGARDRQLGQRMGGDGGRRQCSRVGRRGDPRPNATQHSRHLTVTAKCRR